jgi:hypothetical protein
MNLILKTAMLGTAFLAFNVSADDLGDSKQILCSTLNVNVCQSDGACTAALTSDLNIPQFIEIDTKSGRLATTAASGENRETAASQVIPMDDHWLIHGDQLGRAFSLLIQKSTGQASFASVADGNAVVVFAACTPRQK